MHTQVTVGLCDVGVIVGLEVIVGVGVFVGVEDLGGVFVGVIEGVTLGVTAIGVVMYSFDGDDDPPLLHNASVYT